MDLLDRIVGHLQTPQKVYPPAVKPPSVTPSVKPPSVKSQSVTPSVTTPTATAIKSLAEITEISRQNLVPLDILQRYRFSNQRLEPPAHLNVILWSARPPVSPNDSLTQVQYLQQPNPPDSPTLIFYQNKYGHRFPITDREGRLLNYLGPESSTEPTSFLLLRLIQIISSPTNKNDRV